jgi:hypothetical protein
MSSKVDDGLCLINNLLHDFGGRLDLLHQAYALA